jgi:glycosyltransferase involved in cell wall biosynthesis
MERMTVNLANALSAQGHEVDILLFKDRRDLMPVQAVKVHAVDFERLFRWTVLGALIEFLTVGLVGRVVRRSRRLFSSLWVSPMFTAWVRARERKGRPYDLMVARGFGSFEGLAFVRDPRLVRVIVNEVWDSPRDPWSRLFFRASFSGRRVFFNSAGLRDAFVDLCRRMGVVPLESRVVRNPTDLAQIRLAAEAAIEAPARYIVNVGRLERAKNQHLLLQAFATIAGQVPHDLVIVGGGSLAAELRSQAEALQIGGRVHFAGEQENPYPWMRGADLLVLSSIHEGLPNVVIEAFACGTPVVVTRGHGGAVELMQGEFADLVAEPEPAALGDRIVAALARRPAVDPAFIEGFSAEQVAREFLRGAEAGSAA